MSGLSDIRINAENLNSKKVIMNTRDKSESGIRNKEDVLEDVQEANIHSGNRGDLGKSMSEDEWEDAAEELTETEASNTELEGSNQMSQPQMTEGAVGGFQQSETTEGAVGGTQQKSQAQATEGAVGGSQQSETTEGAVGGSQQSETTEGAVGGTQKKSQSQTTKGVLGEFWEPSSLISKGTVGGCQQISVFPPLFQRYLHKPADPSEELLQSKFITQVTKYEGAPVAPSEDFELQWTVYQDELDGYLTRGLLPQDTVASAGIDEESYTQMQQCAEALQDQLFEGNLLLCLGNLRGFRRIFSRSKDPFLRHAFRGNPLEVLQNIYYGGEGILPEDRMLLDDPFHYTKNPDDLDN